MVQAIGLMIAAYIITRMVIAVSRKGDRAESRIANLFAYATIAFTLLMVMVLLASGSVTP